MARREPDRLQEGLIRGRPFRAAAGLLACLVAALALYAVVVEPRHVTRHDLTVGIAGLPVPFDGYRILHLSDLEAERPGDRERQVLAIAREARPDLVVVTGDVIRKDLPAGRKWKAASAMAAWLGALPSRDGVWFVPGHGETSSRFNETGLRTELERAGVRSLWDEVALVSRGGAALGLAGIRAHNFADKGVWDVRPDGSIRQGAGSRPSYLELDAPGSAAWSDYEVTGRMRIGSHEDWAGVMLRSRLGAGEDRFYMILRRSTRPFLGVSVHGTELDGGGMRRLRPMPHAVWHRFRAAITTGAEAVRLRARVWAEGEAEPDGWDLDYLDTTTGRIAGGTVGLYAEGPGIKQFSDIRVDGRGLAELSGRWAEPPGADFLLALRSGLPAGTPMILLSHTPDIFPDASELGIPLVLAGHTQGGQIRLPLIGALVTDTALGRHRASGLFAEGDSLLFINRGVGTSRFPVRFLAPPEAAVITLTGAPS